MNKIKRGLVSLSLLGFSLLSASNIAFAQENANINPISTQTNTTNLSNKGLEEKIREIDSFLPREKGDYFIYQEYSRNTNNQDVFRIFQYTEEVDDTKKIDNFRISRIIKRSPPQDSQHDVTDNQLENNFTVSYEIIDYTNGRNYGFVDEKKEYPDIDKVYEQILRDKNQKNPSKRKIFDLDAKDPGMIIPLKIGDKYGEGRSEMPEQVSDDGTVRWKFNVLKREDITINGKKYPDCYKIVYEGTAVFEDDSWFYPGIGIIKETSESRYGVLRGYDLINKSKVQKIN